jgi:hypothetical protein
MNSPIIKFVVFLGTIIGSIAGIINGTLTIAEHGVTFLYYLMAVIFAIGVIEPVIGFPAGAVLLIRDGAWIWGIGMLAFSIVFIAYPFFNLTLNIGLLNTLSIHVALEYEAWFRIVACCLIGIMTIFAFSMGLYEQLSRDKERESK